MNVFCRNRLYLHFIGREKKEKITEYSLFVANNSKKLKKLKDMEYFW